VADERFQALMIDSNEKFRKVLRLVYLIAILLLTLVTSLYHDQAATKTIVGRVLAALDVVDPFYIVNHLYLFASGSIPQLSSLTTYMD
jgi:hypothetical protein